MSNKKVITSEIRVVDLQRIRSKGMVGALQERFQEFRRVFLEPSAEVKKTMKKKGWIK